VKEPVWIDERDALALHDRLLALHGGAVGLRDDGLLKSALARPQQHLAYAESPDIGRLGRRSLTVLSPARGRRSSFFLLHP
jgi:prophage maintenance system killer protein